MKNLLYLTIPISILVPAYTFAIEIKPTQVIQGEPIIITLPGTTPISQAYIHRNPVYFDIYNGKQTALYGVDINAPVGTTTVVVVDLNGVKTRADFLVLPRLRYEAPLPVPDKLGGNSAENQKRVISVLAKENEEIARVFSRKDKTLWKNDFVFPIKPTAIKPLFITDPYGYNRKTGENTVTHKGTDFRATKGTPVYAINRGVVRTAKEYTVYGKTIIVDHGLGLTSLYMHLSRMFVSGGQLVERGALIGYSGDTGYAEAPHLHISIKIDNISIDPMKFFELFGQNI